MNFVQRTRNEYTIHRQRERERKTSRNKKKQRNVMFRNRKDSLSDTHTHALKHGKSEPERGKQNIELKKGEVLLLSITIFSY